LRRGRRGGQKDSLVADGMTTAALGAAFLLAGWLSAGLQPNHDFVVAGLETLPDRVRGITVVGVVEGDPEPVTAADGRIKAWRFPLAAESAFVSGEARSARGGVTVIGYAVGGVLPPAYGERWECGETMMVIREGRMPAIHGSLAGFRRLSEGHGSSWLALCFKARRGASDLLGEGIANFPMVEAILRALLLGYRSELDPELRNIFVATGTLHIFAISGSHVVVMAGMILFVARLFRLPRTRWVVVLAPVLVVYTAGTGAAASAVRAALMAIIFWLSGLLGRRPDTLSAVALSAILILVIAPGQLVELGFILSFAVVIGLILLQPPIAARMRTLWAPDPLRVQPESRWTQMARNGGEQLAGLVSLSITAWLVSTPLTACFFSRFTPIALVSNLVVVPLSFLVMVSGCLSISTGLIAPCLAAVFNSANVALVNGMVGMTSALSKVPGGNVEIEPWSVTAVVFWYAVLAGLAWRERGKLVDRRQAA
jgi:ComEC/Rec2-related protein